MSSSKICYPWMYANVLWVGANWTWGDCLLVQEIITDVNSGGVDATTLIQPWLIQPWNPYKTSNKTEEKRKRLIKLICKVKGETYEEEKEVGDYNITINDIKTVVKSVSGVDLDIKV